MLVTLSGIVTLVKLVQFSNALSPISVTDTPLMAEGISGFVAEPL